MNENIRELQEKAIGILIELRQQLAKAEGMEIWEQESQNASIFHDDLGLISSGDVQEMIWWLDL
jgi:hypothetical protein